MVEDFEISYKEKVENCKTKKRYKQTMANEKMDEIEERKAKILLEQIEIIYFNKIFGIIFAFHHLFPVSYKEYNSN